MQIDYLLMLQPNQVFLSDIQGAYYSPFFITLFFIIIMRNIIIEMWLQAWCNQMRKSSPSQYMIDRVNQSVSLLSDDEISDWILS